MKYQGEIVDIKDNTARVRIYKKEEPVNLVLNVNMNGEFSVSDMVNVKVNALLFFACSVFSYLVPFLAAFLSYTIANSITDSIVITEIVVLAVLTLTYFGAKFFEESKFFKKLSFGTIIDKI